MGQVYLAEHIRMKRKSAIKIMRPSLVGESDALQRFTREAENASQLSHPNIAAIFDFGESSNGTVYLAMEYVDGVPLSDKLNDSEPLHPDVAADILGQAADALQAAHDMHMLHRDIKPDNIMLGKRADGTYMVKLVDFGIARTMDNSEQKMTRTGFAVGTPQYMSPEQLAGDTLDARSDQYSLALVAFFALTGKQAFPADTSKESLIARLTKHPQSLQHAREDIHWPESLQQIFDRALSPEPIDRFDTVSDFSHALSGAISQMTPSQTAELYRRALDMRVASVAARTPHTDLESLRTPSGNINTMGLSASRDVRTSGTGSREAVRATGELMTIGGTNASGSIPIVKPRARWPFMIGGVVVIAAAVMLFASQRKRESAGTVGADSSAANAAAPRDTAKPATTVAQGTKPSSADSAASNAESAKKIAKLHADSIDAARRDSVKKDLIKKKKASADSAARVAAVRSRFPEANTRSMISRGIDWKGRMARDNDLRVVIMAPPMFVWRAEEAAKWREGNQKPGGGLFPLVDPIEKWSAWKSLVSSRRAVYAIEVAPDKVPWPAYAPEKIFDIRRGDVQSVELTRDGVPVAFDAPSRVPAFVNPAEHLTANKSAPSAFVFMVSPTTFTPHEDGSWPKIEVLVHDNTRAGKPIKVSVSESMVKRLYDDLAPWRDAIAKP